MTRARTQDAGAFVETGLRAPSPSSALVMAHDRLEGILTQAQRPRQAPPSTKISRSRPGGGGLSALS